MPTIPPPPPEGPVRLETSAYTHPGRQREENEDAFGVFPESRLFVVADGMGGRAAGAVAARLAVDELEAFFREKQNAPRSTWPFPVDKSASLGANLLRVGMKVANQKIRQAASTDPSYHRMGSTVAALAVGQTQIWTAHVGDVRVYRLRQGVLKRLTRDHSLLEEMRAARPDMTEEEIAGFAHRNVVTKALGTREDVEATVYETAVGVGDVYLLCCDGLWSVVRDEQIEALVMSTEDLEQAGQMLIDAANEAGGPDNVTAMLVRVRDR
jgi:protein phosphatase